VVAGKIGNGLGDYEGAILRVEKAAAQTNEESVCRLPPGTAFPGSAEVGILSVLNAMLSLASITPTRLAAALIALVLFAWPVAGAESKKRGPAEWVTLKGCQFMSSEESDGDSFHVKYGLREFIFRLYFVDAPETDEKLTDRVKEQCEYFGVTIEEHRKAAAAAKKFTAEWLKTPMVITTRWQNAMGRSRLPRYYALIETSGNDLAEMLVRRGLAAPRERWRFFPTAPGQKITWRS
jgi:hypothetical protein